MRCVPKSHGQAYGEVKVTADFLNNFAGDNVRRLAKSFGVPGDHYGQMSVGHRWPYGPVALITPFNFPLEIPVLQLMGSLFMGNKPVLKPSEQVSFVMEQFLRLLIDCGMDPTDVDFLNCRGPVAQELILETPVRLTQFTGSSRVAEFLLKATNGKVKIEDAGFDWKVIGPDVGDVDYVAWQCDQDAYASIGQKCSAQSICFVHENWKETGLLDKMRARAATRSLDDFTVGPVLTVTTKQILDHSNNLASIPGAEILWGGKELQGHQIPKIYGAVEPTAVYVPLEEMMKKENFGICVSEIFAPFQVITYYNDDTLDLVLEALEGMSHHLTAACVSNDPAFQSKILAHTVNGTTYAGRRARTTVSIICAIRHAMHVALSLQIKRILVGILSSFTFLFLISFLSRVHRKIIGSDPQEILEDVALDLQKPFKWFGHAIAKSFTIRSCLPRGSTASNRNYLHIEQFRTNNTY